MGQIMSAESRKRRRKLRKKGRMKKFLSWVWGFIPRPFGRTAPKRNMCEMARLYSENHAHIVCEHEKNFVPVMSFLTGKDVLELHKVPGKAVDTKMKMTTPLFRRLLIGIFLRFQLMHSEGKSLNGDFSVDSIYVPHEDILMTPYIDVKFDKLPLDPFQPCTKEAGEFDLMRIGYIIQHDILSLETELPEDLNQLLTLLRSNPFDKRSLIYSHISLKGLKDKLSYFMWMYKRLTHLKKENPNKYANIMQKIRVDVKGWRNKALKNKYLARLRPIVRNQKQGGYSGDGEGQCRFYRNSVEHLPEMFDENNTNLEQKSGTQLAPASQQNRDLPATSRPDPKKNGTQPEEDKPTAQLKPEAKRKGAHLTRNHAAAKRNGTLPATDQPALPENGTQPAANQVATQRKGAESAAKISQLAPNQLVAKMNGTLRATNKPAPHKNGTQTAANQAAAQWKGAQSTAARSQLAPNQPVAKAHGAPTAAQVNGASPVAQTNGTQLAPADKEEEGEELDDFHAAIILVDTFPKFLGDLQEAIYEEGELESCLAEGPTTHGQKLSLQVS